MLEFCLILLGLFIVTRLVEQYTVLPNTLALLMVALVDNILGGNILKITGGEFDQILFLTLPLFIASDALMLTLKEIKDNAFSLIYTAFISVILSVAVMVLLDKLIFPDYNIPASALIMLACMVLATDPITVTSVFSKFNLPHKLKVIAEGESLFNDAFALIIFFLALNVFKGEDLTAISLVAFSAKMIIGSILIGLVFGALGIFMLKLTKDVLVETVMLLFIAYASFYVAELFHLAGILSIIVCIVTAKTVIDKRIDCDVRSPIVVEENQILVKKLINFLVGIAGVVLFVSMGEVMNFHIIAKYWKEVLAVFGATTIIRAIMMSKFAWISNNVVRMEDISFHWWQVLTFSGVKGGLSIVMVHLIPSDFKYKDLFEAIVFGNIILSTFIYAGLLILFIALNKKKFEKECALEH